MQMLLIRFLLWASGVVPLVRAITRWSLRWVGHSLLPLKPISESAVSLQPALSAPSDFESIAPKTAGEATRAVSGVFPSLLGRRISNAIVHCHSSAVVTAEHIVLPDYYYENRKRISPLSQKIKVANGKCGIIDTRVKESLPVGIAIFGNGSSNYYHWLIEILPAAFLSQRLGDEFQSYPFLVPEEYEKYSSFRDSLEVFRAGRSVISMRSDRQYHIDDLVIIDSPVHGPFNLPTGIWPEVNDYSQNTSVLTAFRENILNALAVSSTTSEQKIFLARGNTRRNYNQDELIEIAKSFGFEVVFPENLTFLEQLQLFQSASIVVGASGAAWANMLFCKAGSRGLTWVFPEYRGFCAYSNLAKIVGLDLQYLFSTADRTITSSTAAYRAAYRVDPELFQTALNNLVIS
jgi:hypothetical protein